MIGRILFLRFTDRHQKTAAHILQQKVLPHIFAGCRREITVIDNALPVSFRGHTEEGWDLVGGDNSLREFSGWEKVLAELPSLQAWGPADPVLLVNDTFHRNYDTSYLDHLSVEPVARYLTTESLIGHVDLYPREIHLLGLPMRHWIRSSFVLGTWGTIARLLPLIPKEDLWPLFSDSPKEIFRKGGVLSPLYKQYLSAFLLGSVSEYRCRWHTEIPSGVRGRELLNVKALTIICEHWLSARARQLGIPLRDISGRFAEREQCIGDMALHEKDNDDEGGGAGPFSEKGSMG